MPAWSPDVGNAPHARTTGLGEAVTDRVAGCVAEGDAEDKQPLMHLKLPTQLYGFPVAPMHELDTVEHDVGMPEYAKPNSALSMPPRRF